MKYILQGSPAKFNIVKRFNSDYCDKAGIGLYSVRFLHTSIVEPVIGEPAFGCAAPIP